MLFYSIFLRQSGKTKELIFHVLPFSYPDTPCMPYAYIGVVLGVAYMECLGYTSTDQQAYTPITPIKGICGSVHSRTFQQVVLGHHLTSKKRVLVNRARVNETLDQIYSLTTGTYPSGQPATQNPGPTGAPCTLGLQSYLLRRWDWGGCHVRV